MSGQKESQSMKYLVPLNHHIKETEHLASDARWNNDDTRAESLELELKELYALRAMGHKYYPLF